MKKKTIIFLLAILSIFIVPCIETHAVTISWFTTTSNNYIPGDRANIDEISEVEVGETLQLYGIIVYGADMTIPEEPDNIGLFVDENNLSGIVWTSSNTNIATVDNTGKITGLSPGTTTITAKYNSQRCERAISVREATESVNTGIWFAHSTPEPFNIINEEHGFIILLNNVPDTEKGNIRVTIQNENIAKVKNINLSNSTPGMIIVNTKFLELGNTTMTATLNYNGHTYTDTYSINVTQSRYSLHISAEGYDNLPTTINKGNSIQLRVTRILGTTAPEDVTNRGVTWTTSNESIATITENGIVETHGEGDVTITASYIVGEEIIQQTYNLKVVSPQVVEIPDTGTKAKIYLYIISFIMLACGVIIITHNIKNNN